MSKNTEDNDTMEEKERDGGWDGRHIHPLCVTLERKVSIPGPNHTPSEAQVFRAREHSEGDNKTWFFGLNIGPDNTAVCIKNDNIRSIAVIGDTTDSYADD